jgi:16S rRNA (guanine1207-N2)-methyltransferase
MTLPPRTAEALLIAEMNRFSAGSLLCTSLGRAQFAAAFAQQFPAAHATCHFLDLYQAEQAQQTWVDVSNFQATCTSDFPDGEFDCAVLPCSMQGNAELTREWLQQAHERLKLAGQFAAATDNPQDRWLHEELQKLFNKVTRLEREAGVVYLARKTESLSKYKQFGAEFAFRDGPRILKIISRPGVFSHRQLDLGARALIETMQFTPGERVFEIGCGAGAVTIAAAARFESLQVDAVDVNPRAVDCTLQSAALNGLSNVRVQLHAHAVSPAPGAYDVVLANPPYFSQAHVAQLFVNAAMLALKPTGRLYLVTKKIDWFEQLLADSFQDVQSTEVRGYVVFTAQRV